MTAVPRTREELIDSTLSDEVIEEILGVLILRVKSDGDVRAAQLLLDFRYGRNPEPPSGDESLQDLFLRTPTSLEPLSSE
jgi:hypothetical protein